MFVIIQFENCYPMYLPDFEDQDTQNNNFVVQCISNIVSCDISLFFVVFYCEGES
jgi:hypothetical protein